MLNTINSDSSSKYDGLQLFMARVVDNMDPDKKQRIRVAIPHVLEGAKEELPWLLPLQSTPFGGVTNNTGVMRVPHVGSDVVVFFQEGNLMYGMLMGTTTAQSQDLGVLLENYPKRYGFLDPAGNHFYIDTTEGAVTTEFRHKSGTIVTVDNDGNLSIEVVKDVTMAVTGNVSQSIKGNLDQSVKGEVFQDVQGDIRQTCSSSITVDASSSTTVTAGGTVSVSASSIALDASNVSIKAGSMTSEGSWSHVGNLTVAGSVSGSAGVSGAGVTLSTHVHSNVETGPGFSGPPQ